MPSLIKACNFLDHSVYHLDGVGQIPHLDMLLSIDRLDAIQWVPGAGKPRVASEEWYPLFEQVQSKGKGLVLWAHNADDMLNLLKNFSHKGLFLHGYFKSAEEAEEVIGKAKDYAF
jgi:5-methyltetrahydrofolate--homocysteine methyltransferase